MSRAIVRKEDIGTIIAGMPELPPFNAPAVAADLKTLNEQAVRVLEGAQRAELTTPEAAKVATDFLATIVTRISEVDDKRKDVTGKFDKLVKGLNALYTKGPSFKLEQAKTILQAKLGNYARAEHVKAEVAAEVERQRIATQAASDAAAAVEEGDTEGALEIIESAARVEVVAAKVEVRGASAVLAPIRRKVGKVTDLRQFLGYLVANRGPQALNVLGGITVGQRELNQLAAHAFATNESRDAEVDTSIPGFEASYDETYGAR